jgi:hypothetical protein
MTLNDVLKLLADRCDARESQAAWAKANNLSPSYVSDVLNRRRDPGDSILLALGVERVVGYRPIAGGTANQASLS